MEVLTLLCQHVTSYLLAQPSRKVGLTKQVAQLHLALNSK